MTTRALTLLLAILVLAGCSSAPQVSPTSSSPSASRVWDPMTWHPATPPKLPQLSEQEMSARRLKDLAEMADTLKIKPTKTPALVRWTMPEEQPTPVSQCLRDKGWAAKALPNGVLNVSSVPESQRSALRLDQYECTAQFSIDPRYMSPTPEMYGAVWEYFHDYGVPCLAHFGLAPDDPLPTKQTYVSTSGRFLLYPRDGIVPDEVQIACPQLPPTKAMFSS